MSLEPSAISRLAPPRKMIDAADAARLSLIVRRCRQRIVDRCYFAFVGSQRVIDADSLISRPSWGVDADSNGI